MTHRVSAALGPHVRVGIAEAEEIAGVDRSTLWRWYSQEPPTFPKPHYIGARRMWFLGELEQWAAAQMARPASDRKINFPPRGETKP